MTERDAFEARLGDAVRGYVERLSSDLDPAELAHRIAVAEPRRHGLAETLTWRPVGVPRVAWALLLLAGLIAALVGGSLFVGSQGDPNLRVVLPPVGQVFECPPGSTPDEPGPIDQARPAALTLAVPTLAFDRQAGKLVALTGPADNVETWAVETWTFDVCTNTWTQMHPNREPPPGTGQLVYDIDSDVTIASDGIGMWAYDLEADTWTQKGSFAPFADQGMPNLRFYDPVSGLVVALGDDGDEDTLGLELWSYRVETDTWAPLPQAAPLTIGPHHEDFAYDASVDRLVAYSSTWKPSGTGELRFGPKTWLFDLRTGTWTAMDAVTPEYSYGMWGMGPAVAYDEAAARTLMWEQGHAAAYDATADRWETPSMKPSGEQPGSRGARPEFRLAPQMIYDPVNERLVVYSVLQSDLLAIDTRTGEWTVLLEPGTGQATP